LRVPRCRRNLYLFGIWLATVQYEPHSECNSLLIVLARQAVCFRRRRSNNHIFSGTSPTRFCWYSNGAGRVWLLILRSTCFIGARFANEHLTGPPPPTSRFHSMTRCGQFENAARTSGEELIRSAKQSPPGRLFGPGRYTVSSRLRRNRVWAFHTTVWRRRGELTLDHDTSERLLGKVLLHFGNTNRN